MIQGLGFRASGSRVSASQVQGSGLVVSEFKGLVFQELWRSHVLGFRV